MRSHVEYLAHWHMVNTKKCLLLLLGLKKTYKIYYDFVGNQNIPPQNMPLAPKGHFELKSTEKKQTQEKTLCPPQAHQLRQEDSQPAERAAEESA